MPMRSPVLVLAAWGMLIGIAPAKVTVTSIPGGAEVILKGEATVTGITPTTFNFNLSGTYRLEVRRPGYETYTTQLLLDPNRETVVDVSLVPKTRLKAAARSLFLPGWGQYYSGQKTKGAVILLLAAGTLAGYAIADNDFDHKFARYDDRLKAFDRAVQQGASRTELERLKGELDAAQSSAYDAENTRRIAAGAVIGVWGLSLLDALFFFPEDRGAVTVRGISVTPSYDTRGVRLTLSARF